MNSLVKKPVLRELKVKDSDSDFNQVQYAKVALHKYFGDNGFFTYKHPSNLKISLGSVVSVPFGNEDVYGFYIGQQKADELAKTSFDIRFINYVVGGVGITKNQLKLAYWIAEKWKIQLQRAIWLFSLPSMSKRIERFYFIDQPVTNSKPISLTSKEEEILNFIKSKDRSISQKELIKFTKISSSVTRSLTEKGIIKSQWLYVPPRQYKKIIPIDQFELPRPLNDVQIKFSNKVIQVINEQLYDSFVLAGATGTGKTEVLFHLLQYCVKQKKQALLLLPEISLNMQVFQRYFASLGVEVLLLNSKVNEAARLVALEKIKQGQAKVILGTMSSVFAPFEHIGLVAVDEFHHNSYIRQTGPYINVVELAREIAIQNNAPIIYSSATPPVSFYYKASLDGKTYYLKSGITNGTNQIRKVVDMNREIRAGNLGIFARQTIKAIEQTISEKKRVILFINRKGEFALIQCQQCSLVKTCISCDEPLKVHKSIKLQSRVYKCHLCHKSYKVNSKCDRCGNKTYNFFLPAIDEVHRELKTIFPKIPIFVWDSTKVKTTKQHFELLKLFSSTNASILLGTHVVTKGLNFPDVALACVIFADSELFIPTYRSTEDAYQTLMHFMGRMGRDGKRCLGIIQTYFPDHYVVQSTITPDYNVFYSHEMHRRKQHNLPPASELAEFRLSYRTILATAKNLATIFRKNLLTVKNSQTMSNVEISMPHPSYPFRVNRKYNYTITIKGNNIRKFTQSIPKLPFDVKIFYELEYSNQK